MNAPRFTDAARYPHGYVPAAATNIRATFARVIAQQKAAKPRTNTKRNKHG